MKTEKQQFFSLKTFLIIFVAIVMCLPIIFLFFPKKTTVLSVIVAVMPLVTFLCVYIFLRHSINRAGKGLEKMLQVQTEIPDSSALVLQKLLACSELSVLTTIYTDVVLLKKTRLGMAKSYSIYRYVGKIKSGIQLTDCQFFMDKENQCINVQLPPVQIFDHSIDIDGIEKFDEKSSLFSKITNAELFAEISRRKEEAQQRLIKHGLLDATEARVKLEVTQMLSAMGYNGYDIAIESKPLLELE
ncbi:MAG: DUF4230 domain-containing protein [Spirochaetaceae bacterium]|nr:DUF4230 domain-containing protein [Spirochaetaceae bacterium]